MALRNIRINDDEVLRKKCKVVPIIDKKIKLLIEDMAETMYKNDGVGLAAPQVGILKRIAVVNIGEGLIVLINPEILKEDGEQIGSEGCLSIPNVSGEVKRPKKVTVKAMDINGEYFEITGEDLLARAFCHEIDHLDGILFTDHVTKFDN